MLKMDFLQFIFFRNVYILHPEKITDLHRKYSPSNAAPIFLARF